MPLVQFLLHSQATTTDRMNGQFGFNPASMMSLTGYQTDMPGSTALANMEGAFSGDKQSVFANMRTYVENPSGHLITPTRYQNVSASGYAPVNTIGAFIFATKSGQLTNPIGKQSIVCLHHFFMTDKAALLRHIGIKDGKIYAPLKQAMQVVGPVSVLLPLGIQKTAFHGANGRNEASVAIRGETEIKNFFGPIRAGDRIFAVIREIKESGGALGDDGPGCFILVSRGSAYQALQELQQQMVDKSMAQVTKLVPLQPLVGQLSTFVVEIGTALADSFWDKSSYMDFITRNATIAAKFGNKSIDAMDRTLSDFPMLKIMVSGEIHDMT